MSFALRSLKWMLWGKRIPRKIVFTVGLYTLFYPFYDMGEAAIRHNVQEPVDLRTTYGVGSIAVITGANNSTGLAFAERLSKQGFRLICVADKDDESCQKLRQQYPSAEILLFDFGSSSSHKDYEKLCTEIQAKAKDHG